MTGITLQGSHPMHIVLVVGLERTSYTVSETIRVVNVSGNDNTSVIQRASVRVCAVVFEGTIARGSNALVSFTTRGDSATNFVG